MGLTVMELAARKEGQKRAEWKQGPLDLHFTLKVESLVEKN